LLKPNALIYKHSDGYPLEKTNEGEKYGMLVDLPPFLRKFNKLRGLDDAEYAAAQTLYFLIKKSNEHRIAWNKECKKHKLYVNESPQERERYNFLGYGIDNVFHGDIEYYYAVRGNELEVYSVNIQYGQPTSQENFKLLQTVSLKSRAKASCKR
jgi:hypothetical protein